MSVIKCQKSTLTLSIFQEKNQILIPVNILDDFINELINIRDRTPPEEFTINIETGEIGRKI